MRILLINPPDFNELIASNPRLIESERGTNPPLGLLSVASYLEQFSNYEVTVIDSVVEKLDYEQLKLKVQECAPDVVGITCMTFTLVDVFKTVELVKRINRNIKVVLGGIHVNIYPDETMSNPNIDYLVMGEGEETFFELLKCIEYKGNPGSVKGIVFKRDGNIIFTESTGFIDTLDSLPFPARHLVPYKKYSSLLMKRSPVTTIFTSRGCPFKCSFCDRPHLGKTFRARSYGNVVDELEKCVNMGIRDFLVYDDTFTVSKERTVQICKEIVKRKLDINWDIRARVDTIDEETLKYFKRAGCTGIHYGVEAGTERILKKLRKGITVDQVKSVVRLTRKYGISTLTYFMIGCPSETLEEIRATFKVMNELKQDYVHLTIFTPFPATQAYHDGLKAGIIKRDCWREFALNPTQEFVPPHWSEFFSRNELEGLLIEGYKGFYARPAYVMKKMLTMRSWSELKKKVKAGVKVLKMRSCYR